MKKNTKYDYDVDHLNICFRLLSLMAGDIARLRKPFKTHFIKMLTVREEPLPWFRVSKRLKRQRVEGGGGRGGNGLWSNQNTTSFWCKSKKVTYSSKLTGKGKSTGSTMRQHLINLLFENFKWKIWQPYGGKFRQLRQLRFTAFNYNPEVVLCSYRG